MNRMRFPNQKGQAAVEFSLTFLIFIVLFVVLSGLGRIAYNWMILQYAASEASRFGSLGQVDPGLSGREESIRNRVMQITDRLGLDGVTVELFDEFGGSTAGAGSEFFRVRVSRTLALQSIVGTLFKLVGMVNSPVPTYEVTAWTVIRNEPF